MDIEKIKFLKAEMDKKILEIITEFQVNTGLVVTYISIEHKRLLGYGEYWMTGPVSTKIESGVELKL